ncbi:MAG: hypothetical protein IJ006_07560 [Lachnospiraceae bacterium]|nr:hypothetical protein [Lachnospiraceae bacterium]
MTGNGLTVVKKMTKKERDAEAVVQKSLQQLKNRYGFLLHAISIFKPVAVEERIQPATDGKHLFFNAKEIIKCVKQQKSHELLKQIFHMLLHGIYGDFEAEDEEQWRLLHWVTMDFKIARTMDLLGFYDWREFFEWDVPELIAEPALYLKARNDKNIASKIIGNQQFVKSDSHEYWARKRTVKGKSGEQSQSDREQDEKALKAEVAGKWREVRELLIRQCGCTAVGKKRKNGSVAAGEPGGEILVEELVDGIRRGGYGFTAGNMFRDFFAEKKKTSDYRAVLRRLLQFGESAKEEDTIDYNLYLYGLECYGDVPLIEPAEVTEKLKMDTLVLATDTSGSCEYAIPEFLGETIQILQDVAGMTEQGKVYYLECDTEITEQKVYEDFNTAVRELSHKKVTGFGGTDFRPVFSAMEEYRAKGEKIDALFYLSDGDGAFPEEAPDYPVYFVMKENWKEAWGVEMPEWVNVILI